MLELKGVTKVYETGGLKHKALNKVSINFRVSEFVAILGPSGSGKTTLLNIIGGLDHYTSGEMKINEVSTRNFKDKDWDAYRNHRIGFVFQAYNLIPHQTVLNNVKLALTLSGISKREATRRAKRALEEVGLKDHINKKPGQLSGGQMQRVAIARALVNDPEILLADEPTGALDSETSLQIMNLLKEIAKNKLVVMVTHNPELAEAYATRIVTLKDGEIQTDSNKYDGREKTNLTKGDAAARRKKTKMSFMTALMLSLNNLLTKKGRTVLVAFAGSIGIIGIALILAVSTGFQGYIDAIEEDTLTSYPLALRRESTNITGVLLGALVGGNGDVPENGKVKENQLLTSMLGHVTKNDLKSFMNYYDGHADELKGDVRIVEYEYSVDPLIYTIDATNTLAKVNPSSLFTSLVGDSSLLSSYSSMTSVFMQYELENMKNDTNLVAGRYPEKYNEMVLFLSDASQISDLLTYSLGLHDSAKLGEMVTAILAGESVEVREDPLELTYEDLMNVDLRLIYNADTYKYNATYNIYEDMSENKDYMMQLYNGAERLKIVGVTTAKDGLMSSGSGVMYLPDLVTHIIEKDGETEIVKKQVASPTIDVFSGKKFGENESNYNLQFSDLMEVDSSKLSSAIGVNIDQNAVATKTGEYMNEIADDITADVGPVKQDLTAKLDEIKAGFQLFLVEKATAGEIDLLNPDLEKLAEFADEYVAEQDFSELVEKYLLPEESFVAAFQGFLKLSLVPGQEEVLAEAINVLSVSITEIVMKAEILTAVGGLTSYLTSSFANAFSIDADALMGAFSLKLNEEELTRIVTTMFTKKESTYTSNLALLGYQELDDPTHISFYFTSFDGKTHFMEFIDHYNELMREYGQEAKVIEYSDTTGVLMNSVKIIVDAVSYVLIAFVSISLVVSSIMIGIITYISVYERTKEIGILRAIGASKRNISSIFNAETFIVGLLSGLFGITISYILIPIINLVLHIFTGNIPLSAQLMPGAALVLVVLAVILTLIGGLIPARAASKKDPVEALRSE